LSPPFQIRKFCCQEATVGDQPGRPQSAGLLDSKKETEEILNSILPPRCWEEDGQLWTQTVGNKQYTMNKQVKGSSHGSI
jgi:dynein light intermediate chain, axonemal